MTDVEFVDPSASATPPAGTPPTPTPPTSTPPTGGPDASGQAPEHPATLRDLRELAWPVVFWLIAAGCAVAAPFTTLYGVRFPDGPSQYVDGWGRVSADVEFTDTPGHDMRYGVVYVAAAAVLVGLVALTLRRRYPAVQRVAAVSVAGVLAGATAIVALDIEALVSRIHVSSSAPGIGNGGSAAVGPTVLVGPLVWLSLAALIAATVGAVLQAAPRPIRARRLARARRTRATEADPEPHRDDELLG